MRFDLFTLFPAMFSGVFDQSIIKRARERELLDIRVHDIRAAALDRHATADDYPYGGGPGMVMKPEPFFRAVEQVDPGDAPIILLSARGRLFTQQVAREYALLPRLLLLCGHYEGVDQRVVEHLATEELSIGDYILPGGELAAAIVVEVVARLIPGVLGAEASLTDESHEGGVLEYPQYTRPPEFRGWPVPEVLLSGHHARISQWRREQALLLTLRRRPDLLRQADLTAKERAFLRLHGYEADSPTV